MTDYRKNPYTGRPDLVATKAEEIEGLAVVARTGNWADLVGEPVLPGVATEYQGTLAETALQPTGDGSGLRNMTKAQVGLGNVDNTSDAGKPVSTATQAALDTKAPLAGLPWVATTSANIATAAASAIANGKPLLIPVQVDITSDTDLSTVPEIRVVHGGSFNISTGVTLTLPTNLIAGTEGIFTGAGSVAGKLSKTLPEWWGAKGDGVTNDTIAIQKAIAATPSKGTLKLSDGANYLVSLNAIVIKDINVDGENSKITVTQTGAGVAVDIGDGLGEYYKHIYRLGEIVYSGAGAGTAWQTGAIGVRCRGFYNSELHVKSIEGFEKNLYMSAGANGVADTGYSKVYFGKLMNGKPNLYIDAGTGDSWDNEINYYGSQLGHTSGYGTNVAGAHHIQIVNTSANRPNAHKMWGFSVEGNTHENGKTIVTDGMACAFLGFRFEANNPGVVFNTGAERNWVDNSYGGDSITLQVTDNYVNNRVTQSGKRETEEASGGTVGTHVYSNFNGGPSLVVKDHLQDVHNGSSADWSAQMGESYVRGKAAADAYARWQLDNASGSLSFGSGSAPTDASIYRVQANIVGAANFQPTGNYYAADGKGLANHTSPDVASFNPKDSGPQVYRAVADVNPALWVYNASTGSTGGVVKLQHGTKYAVVYVGSGSPEGVVAASKGAIYIRDDGGTGTTFYIKENGAGNTGWATSATSAQGAKADSAVQPTGNGSLPSYASNAAAVTGGLAVGTLYRQGDFVAVVH